MSDKNEGGFMPPRILTLTGPIVWDTVEPVSDALATLNALSDEPVTIRICSPGGNLMCGLAIYDLIALSNAPVTTVGLGLVGSAAAILFQAGRVRLLAPNARLTIHLGNVELEGSFDQSELDKIAGKLFAEDGRVDALMARRCRVPVSRIRAWSEESKTFFPDEAVQLGLADGVLRHAPYRRAKKKDA